MAYLVAIRNMHDNRGGTVPKNILFDKMKTMGYLDLEDFYRRSGIKEHLSRDTCRRAIYGGAAINIPSLIVITKFLGFPPKTITKIIKDAGDTLFHSLISHDDALSDREAAVIAALRDIQNKNPALLKDLANYLELLGKAAGVDVTKHLTSLLPVHVPKGGKSRGGV